MANPSSMASIGIDRGVMRNIICAFVLNNVEAKLASMDVVTTKCSGLFCDRQRAVEILRGNRACGCYMMQTRVGNVVLVHDVDVSKNGERIVTMEDFSSIEFSKLYLKKFFNSSIRFNQLDYNDTYFSIQKVADDIVKYINENGGFTVIGWYKRGEINDISNEESQNEVESSDIGYHIVSIVPTNRLIVDRTEFNSMKFDPDLIV